MTIYTLAHMFKKTYTQRQMIYEYSISNSDMEKHAFGIALGNYPFN